MSEQPSEERRDDEVGTSLPGMIADAGREAGSEDGNRSDPSGGGEAGMSDSDGAPVGQADVKADKQRSGADD